MNDVFSQIRARSLLVFLLIGIGLLIASSIILGSFNSPLLSDPIFDEILLSLFFQATLVSWLIWVFRRYQLSLKKLLGKRPPVSLNWIVWISTIILTIIFSIGSYQIVYTFLSYLFPEFVEALINERFLVSADESNLSLFYNVLQTAGGVILAPIIEEIIFRGIFLHRWGLKWGIRKAIITVSFFFAIVHIDFIGGFVFGLLMALIYIRTNSLYVPILLHFFNNLLAFGLSLSVINSQDIKPITIDQFRDGWSSGVIFVAISLPWLLLFIKKYWPKKETTLPYYT